jgi:hypothetical protein
MALQHLRSSTANKRPTPAGMSDGQLAMNTNSGSPGLFLKDSSGALVKVGPVHVGATAPNASPASGGQSGNTVGEQWLDTSGSTYVFKIWDGSAWRSEAGEFVNTTGDVMTGALGIIAGSAGSPGLYVSGDANTGVYSPGADQLALATGGTGRLFVDASGRVIVGASSAAVGNPLEVVATSNGNAIAVRGRSSDNSGNITFHPNASSTEYARIQAESDSSLRFGTGSTGSERMRLDSSGRLGLGTTSVAALLHLNGGSAALPVTSGTTQSAGNRLRLSTATGSGILDVGCAGASGMWLQSTDSTDLSIEYPLLLNPNGGSVGIGTASPGSPLTIESNAGNQIKITYPSIASYFLNATSGGDFAINKDGTERARIDSSGRLLVGTSTAQGDFTLQLQGDAAGATAAGSIYLRRGLNTAAIGGNVGADLGSIDFGANDGTIAGRIECLSDATWSSTSDTPGRLVFSTTADGASSPTERMRIKSDGVTSFGQGATGPGSGVAGTLINAGDGGILITNNTAPFLRCYTLSGGFPDALQIAANGNVTNANNSYGAISDAKLKENIVNANSQWDDLKAFRVRNYNLKEGQTHTQIGLVAQEAELVSPGIVSESPDCDEDGNDLGTVTKSVNYSVLYMKAVKALQEAMERIEALEARIAAAGI